MAGETRTEPSRIEVMLGLALVATGASAMGAAGGLIVPAIYAVMAVALAVVVRRSKG